MTASDNGFSVQGAPDVQRPEIGGLPFFTPPEARPPVGPSSSVAHHGHVVQVAGTAGTSPAALMTVATEAAVRSAEPTVESLAGPSQPAIPSAAAAPPGSVLAAPPQQAPQAAAQPASQAVPSMPQQLRAAPGAPGTAAEQHGGVAASGPGAGSRAGGSTTVEGRIRIEDDLIEKIAMLAAMEVHGVAGPGGGAPDEAGGTRAGRAAGRRGGAQAVVKDDEVTLDLVLAVTYGSVVMDVARVVKTNVARVVGRMLGLRVTAVNIVIDDVRMQPAPGDQRPGSPRA